MGALREPADTVSAPAAPQGFAGRFYTDHRTRSVYAEAAGPYRIVPAAVALPEHLDDVVALVRAAADGGWALIPRGAGSGIPGSNVGAGVVVDIRRLRHPLTVSEPDRRAAVGAAVTWRQLDDAAATVGLRLPPDPSSFAFCTLGGMVATNAAGSRSVRHGSIRPWVRAIELVTGHGVPIRISATDSSVPEFLSTIDSEIQAAAGLIRARFPRTRKNTAGYALDSYLQSGCATDLVIGSEGTLGVITEIELRLAPRPAAVAGLLVALPEVSALTDAVRTLLPLRPAALELLDRSFLRIVEYASDLPIKDWAGVLLIDFEGTRDEVDHAVQRARKDVRSFAAHVRTALDPHEHADLWKLRHAASPVLARLPTTRRSLQIVEDGCVPVARLSDYLAGVHQAAEAVGVEVVAFGHAGDGHLHVNALIDTTDPDCVNRLEALLEQTTALVIACGGTPSGEHGDGRLRAPAVERLYGPELLALFGRLKSAFDPAGVFNPGVIVAQHGGSPLDGLKVGPHVADIPGDVAAALRRIERTGGWGLSPLEALDHREPG
jgi:FAD/FMN-containing dehydrogenase